MIELSVLHGWCTIQLYKKVGGSNAHLHTIKRKVIDNALVDEIDFQSFSRPDYHWLKDSGGYVCRWERSCKGYVYMGREVLKLSRMPGNITIVADHKNHDIRDNRKENLRIATKAQNKTNGIKKKITYHRFKGVMRSGDKYVAYIGGNKTRVCFASVLFEIEAGLMHKYASIIIYDKFACVGDFPQGELPTRERQWELIGMVVEKLRTLGYI